jgi:phage baseplate assembly protein W
MAANSISEALSPFVIGAERKTTIGLNEMETDIDQSINHQAATPSGQRMHQNAS